MTDRPDSTRVNIYGREYSIRGEGDPAYVAEIAHFVDMRMREMTDNITMASTSKVAILAAQKKALDKEIDLSKSTLLKPGGQYLRKYNPDNFSTFEEGIKTTIRAQIEITQRKLEGVDVRLNALDALEQKVDTIKTALIKNPKVNRPYMALKNEIRIFRERLNDWKTEATEAVQMWQGKV